MLFNTYQDYKYGQHMMYVVEATYPPRTCDRIHRTVRTTGSLPINARVHARYMELFA